MAWLTCLHNQISCTYLPILGVTGRKMEEEGKNDEGAGVDA